MVGKVQQQFDYGIGCMPDRVWPQSIEERERFVEVPGHLWRPSGASVNMLSNISCMKMYGKHSDSDGLPRQHLMYPFRNVSCIPCHYYCRYWF